MSSTKRATWIEGTTKSNRILRDLSEIFTSANRDDMGISKTENWELVYPRPFEEYSVVRGTLLQDGVNTRHYTPVIDRREIIELYDGIDAKLEHDDVIVNTIVVRSEDLSKEYEVNVDYNYDAATQSISRIAGGAIAASERLDVRYGTKVAQILDSVPVHIEKVLKEPNPDRPIDPMEYSIDYFNNRVIFTVAPPTDAAYFALSFTDVTDTWTRVPHEKLQLEMDLLDPTGHTYKLPPSAKQIGELNATNASGQPVHEVIAAQSTAGTTGLSVTGSGIVYEITHDSTSGPTSATIRFISGAPALADNQQLLLRAYEYNDFVTKSSWTQKDLVLVKDDKAPDPDTYRVVGLAQGLHITLGTRVVIHTTFEQPVFYKHLSSLHAGYETLQETAYTVQMGEAGTANEPRILTFMDITEDLIMTFYARDVDDLKKGISKIDNRVVLKTTTEPEQKFETMIENSYGDADLSESLTMYVEFVKPKRLVNPETGLERYTDWKGVILETQLNNHYIEARMFDKWDDSKQAPLEATFNSKGEVLTKGAVVSDWSKYSWFKDWKEYMVDELDTDSGTSNVQDGIIFQEVVVDGMDDEFPIQFWISTNNNRTAMVLMGDPTLDQDNFLTSFGYFGRIHPFYDKECVVKRDESGTMLLDANGNPIIEEKRTYFQNDVTGNFALTVGSSTLPVRVGAAPVGTAFIDSVQIAVDEASNPLNGRLYDYSVYAYAVTYLTESGESKPTLLGNLDARLFIPIDHNGGGSVPTTGSAIRVNFTIPNEAVGYRIYRYHQASTITHGSGVGVHSNYKLVTSVNRYEGSRSVEFIDDGGLLPIESETFDVATSSYVYSLIANTAHAYYNRVAPLVSTSRAFEAVTRDVYTGAVLDVRFPDKWGANTATGVSDIMMFATRSGLKYQRHVASFITTEEFMRKEKSGQSRWTGKFHLSPVYVEHSYDKQRGWLDGVMAVDDSGIEHLDDLIVDKDTPNEEVYKFFRVNAPYSFFNNSANYAYGLAIIKSSLRW